MSDINVIRAWKDEEYRASISVNEQAALSTHSACDNNSRFKARYIMKKRLLKALCAVMFLAPLASAVAAPLSPEARNVSQQFSTTVQDAFTLLADSDDNSLVYYVPRRGTVAVQAPQSENPIPRFSIFARIPSFGFFAGYELVQMGGSLSTTGDLGALTLLQEEATAQGLSVTPAPVVKAGTQFLVAGQVDPVTGRIDVECITEEIDVNGRKVQVPLCNTRESPDRPYELDTNVMYRFAFTQLGNRSTAAQDIAFQATTLPDWSPQLRTLMATGAQWDGILSSKVDWVVRTSNLTRQARAHIKWERLFEQASTFAAFHGFSCIDIEVQGFFERIVDCSSEEECGIRIEYLQADGTTWGPQAPNDANFVNVVNAVERELRSELFNEMRPVLGPVSTEASAAFTLRANYERRIIERNEVRYITYNPGPTDFEFGTVLNISCLMGGFEEGRVSWNLEDPGCRALLGQ